MTSLREYKSLLQIEADEIKDMLERGQNYATFIQRLEEIENTFEIIAKFEKPDSLAKRKQVVR